MSAVCFMLVRVLAWLGFLSVVSQAFLFMCFFCRAALFGVVWSLAGAEGEERSGAEARREHPPHRVGDGPGLQGRDS